MSLDSISKNCLFYITTFLSTKDVVSLMSVNKRNWSFFKKEITGFFWKNFLKNDYPDSFSSEMVKINSVLNESDNLLKIAKKAFFKLVNTYRSLKKSHLEKGFSDLFNKYSSTLSTTFTDSRVGEKYSATFDIEEEKSNLIIENYLSYKRYSYEFDCAPDFKSFSFCANKVCIAYSDRFVIFHEMNLKNSLKEESFKFIDYLKTTENQGSVICSLYNNNVYLRDSASDYAMRYLINDTNKLECILDKEIFVSAVDSDIDDELIIDNKLIRSSFYFVGVFDIDKGCYLLKKELDRIEKLEFEIKNGLFFYLGTYCEEFNQRTYDSIAVFDLNKDGVMKYEIKSEHEIIYNSMKVYDNKIVCASSGKTFDDGSVIFFDVESGFKIGSISVGFGIHDFFILGTRLFLSLYEEEDLLFGNAKLFDLSVVASLKNDKKRKREEGLEEID